jgi:hypothetical protein
MRTFTLTRFDAPALRPGGSPDDASGVAWPVTGRRWSGDFGDLVALLTRPVAAEGKFACPFFLVGAFAGDQRRNAAFESASVVALDVEDGPTTREAHDRFVDVAHLIYTTWRHERAAHRFRVVVPLARDVTAAEYKLLWTVLARRLGRGADPQTKDLARALFLPAVRPDGRRAAAKAWTEAPVLDPDVLLRDALKLVAPRPERFCVTAATGGRFHGQVDRMGVAERLRATVRANRAERLVCPNCGRPSAWFWLGHGRMRGARCNHRNSCGWYGPISQLLDGGDVGV